MRSCLSLSVPHSANATINEMAFVGSAIMTRKKAKKAATKYVARNSCYAFIYRRFDGTFGFTCEVRGTNWAIVEIVK
jgi:hypothetical protein